MGRPDYDTAISGLRESSDPEYAEPRIASLEAARAFEASLPALDGSEKQVAWATEIRHDAVYAWHHVEWEEQARAGLERVMVEVREHMPDMVERAEALVAGAWRTTDAGWWIDGRGKRMGDRLASVLMADAEMQAAASAAR